MLFTIITAVYNDKNNLIHTIESIAQQEHRDFEHIVIDGNSTDGTKEIIKKYTDKIRHWVSEPDNGIYDAMNKGLDKAHGEYIIFMNAGDLFYDSMTLAQISGVIANYKKADFLFGDAIEYDIHGSEQYKKARDINTLWYNLFTHHQAMIFSQKLIGDYRYDENFPLAGDYAFVADLLYNPDLEKDKVVKLDFPICKFLQGGVSSTKEWQSHSYEELREIKNKILDMNPLMVRAIEIFQRLVNMFRRLFPKLYLKIRMN